MSPAKTADMNDQGAVWGMDSGGSKELLRWGPDPPSQEKGNYEDISQPNVMYRNI